MAIDHRDLGALGAAVDDAHAGAPSGDRTPDECGKLGQFYFNPDDSAVWVEKRAGIGYTLNFARPLSWLWLFGIVAGPLILIRVLR